jgi:hypothetical protein
MDVMIDGFESRTPASSLHLASSFLAPARTDVRNIAGARDFVRYVAVLDGRMAPPTRDCSRASRSCAVRRRARDSGGAGSKRQCLRLHEAAKYAVASRY